MTKIRHYGHLCVRSAR